MANNVDTATLRSRRQAALAGAAWGCSSRQLTCSSRAAHVSRQLTCSVHAAASDLAPSLAKLRRRSQPDPAGARCCRPVASVVGVGAAGVALAWTRAARFGSDSRPNARLEALKAAAANGRHCCRSSSASTTSPTTCPRPITPDLTGTSWTPRLVGRMGVGQGWERKGTLLGLEDGAETMDSAGGEPEAGGSVSGASCVSCALKLPPGPTPSLSAPLRISLPPPSPPSLLPHVHHACPHC
eukprot:3237565-Rhodomonas_salina.1